jgi:hypothetical protein
MGRRILTSPSGGAYGCSRVRSVSIFRQAAGRCPPHHYYTDALNSAVALTSAS